MLPLFLMLAAVLAAKPVPVPRVLLRVQVPVVKVGDFAHVGPEREGAALDGVRAIHRTPDVARYKGETEYCYLHAADILEVLRVAGHDSLLVRVVATDTNRFKACAPYDGFWMLADQFLAGERDYQDRVVKRARRLEEFRKRTEAP